MLKHHRSTSSLSDFTLYELHSDEIIEQNPREDNVLPVGTLIVAAEPDKIKEQLHESIEDLVFEHDGSFKCVDWSGKRYYSDYIKAGIEYKQTQDPNYIAHNDVVMLFESPSSCTTDSTLPSTDSTTGPHQSLVGVREFSVPTAMLV